MTVDLGLYLIVAVFVGWEAFAHFVARNRGPHTLSNRVLLVERRFGVPVRVVVAAAVVALGVHLEGVF